MPERSVQNLIAITQAGLSIATFPEIKTAVQNKYKEIYGSDIDLTNTTADGVFIENICLIIHNILTTTEMLYSNLNINTASGQYLDNLCALTGVYRKQPTKSIAQLEITNNGVSAITLSSSLNLTFVDKSGYTWETQVGIETPFETLTLAPNVNTVVDVYCSEYGPVKAEVGWINQLIDLSYDLTISQPREASIGNDLETDGELRARRNETISSIGLSTLSNLKGALLEITGIEDVEVYNNNTSAPSTAKDGTNILSRSIYVVIKKTKGLSIKEEIIGSRIYEKLTPGIFTNQFNGLASTGTSKSYIYNSDIEHGLTNTVYWKEATPIGTTNLKIEIKIKKLAYYSEETDDLLKETLVNYLNSTELNREINTYDLINELNDADPMFASRRTYNVIDVELTYTGTSPFTKTLEYGSNYIYQAKDTYFDIDDTIITLVDPNEENEED